MNDIFRKIANKTSSAVGSPWTFVITLAITMVWLVLGPVFHFSDTWQLTMNTAASQITFLIAFLIQNTQNRDAKALHLKLDELLRTHDGARNKLINLEEMSDEELEDLYQEFDRLRKRAGDGQVSIVQDGKIDQQDQ